MFEKDKQLSRLEWEENAAPYILTRLNFAHEHFFVAGEIKAAVPLESGLMRDYDYLLPGNNSLTNYSEHTAFLERHNVYNIRLGYEFWLCNWLFMPALGFNYTNRKWTAKDGFYQYASTGTALQKNEPAKHLTGPVITYEQKISYPFINLAIGYLLFDRWLICAQFQLSPYLWVESMDHHVMRDTEFYDVMHGGIGFLAGITMTYRPGSSNNIEFVAGGTFERIFEIKGSNNQRTTGLNSNSSFVKSKISDSGMDSQLCDFFFGIKLAFPIKPQKPVE